MNSVINQLILAKCPALGGPIEKPPTNCKTTQLTPERSLYKAVQSTERKGLILGSGVGGAELGLSQEATLHQVLEGRSDLPRWRWAKGRATQEQK